MLDAFASRTISVPACRGIPLGATTSLRQDAEPRRPFRRYAEQNVRNRVLSSGARHMLKKTLLRTLIVGLVLFASIQLVPYGRNHAPPPSGAEPVWPSERAEQLARRACFDCHSHETTWPWYSHVAPVSWLVQRDVDAGREHLNFSAWDRSKEGGEEAAEELQKGDMPPAFYLPAHPEARLSAAEKAELAAALRSLGGGKREGRRSTGE